MLKSVVPALGKKADEHDDFGPHLPGPRTSIIALSRITWNVPQQSTPTPRYDIIPFSLNIILNSATSEIPGPAFACSWQLFH